ncbi:pectin lyase fold/virulence factor [Paraphoma chrysanthemicola]|uniref:Pectin lyase fold/virulence factor n=1 Tax=Paraphoma chrysanthemicola TaxID=798071 RepID=A0A8K0RE05_9PLEO|nr:pectin lyase fold/virulence factor [Paraphoma chrysanthemicola]
MRFQHITAAAMLLVAPAITAPSPEKNADCEATVKPGQRIQDAINKAKRGDRIVVEAGEYHEQLTITTNGIQLIGKPGAHLLPPSTLTPNFCTGLSRNLPPPRGDYAETDAGICIYGKGFELAEYVREHKKVNKTGDYIKDVVVTGFAVSNFTGENIAVIGGKDTRITKNKLTNGGQYGFLTVGSKDTLAAHNVVTSSSLNFIGLCMDDKASPRFIDNDVSNYYIAFCTQTSGGEVKRNRAKDCCTGPFVDPGITGAKIIDNTISGRNALCPDEAGAGIVVFGATNTIVEGNTFANVLNNRTGVGIFVSDDPVSGAKAQGNVFKKNTLRNNDLDIYDATNRTDNVYRRNACDSELASLPMGLCDM